MTEEAVQNTSTSNFSENLKPVETFSRYGKSDNANPNFTIYKMRLSDVVKQLQENHEKWEKAQKRGIVFCKAIESIKTVEIAKAASGDQSFNEESNLYPPELKEHCDKLSMLLAMFMSIADSAEECLKKLHSLKELTKIGDPTFYRTWKIEHFVNFVEQLVKLYKLDIQNKEWVKKELPHCITKPDLVNFVSEWEYPETCDSSLGYLFAILREETKITMPELDLK